jgi:hypothetical protein
MTMYTHVEVEANDNCPMSANLAFKNLSEPFAVTRVRIYEGEPGGRLCAVTGWSSDGEGTPVVATAVAVEDSGAGGGYLLYGGDWGIRLRPLDSTEGEWSLAADDQWGETHLVLADREDLLV